MNFWGNKNYQKLGKYDSLLMTVHWTLILSTKQVFFLEKDWLLGGVMKKENF